MSIFISSEVENKDLSILSAHGNVGAQLALSKLPYDEGRRLRQALRVPSLFRM